MLPAPPIAARSVTLVPCTTIFRAGGAYHPRRQSRAFGAVAGSRLLQRRRVVPAAGGGVSGGAAGDRLRRRGRGAFPLRRDDAGYRFQRAARRFRALSAVQPAAGRRAGRGADRSEEHTSELQSLMRISYAVFCLKKKKL